MKVSVLIILLLFFTVILVNVIISCSDNPFIEEPVVSVEIVLPIQTLKYLPVDTITFVSKVFNFVNEFPYDSTFVWYSDKDGAIGTGDSISVNNLSENTHVITFKARDRNYIEYSDSITIKVAWSSSSWMKKYGGSNVDVGVSIIETSDNCYVIAGQTYSKGAGSSDLYLIKVDKDGTLLFDNAFGGIDKDYGSSVFECSDGGYIIAGVTESYGAGGSDVFLVKADINGNLRWKKTFGGADDDFGYSVVQTSDGGFIVTGRTKSMGAGDYDVYLIKTNNKGNLVWERTFGGDESDVAFSVIESSDGGFVITGYTISFGISDADVYIIKTDIDGLVEWSKTFDGHSYFDHGRCVIENSEGNFVVTGYSKLNIYGEKVALLMNLAPTGNLNWEKYYFATNGETNNTYAYSLCETFDGGYVIAGRKHIHGLSEVNVSLSKTDHNGNQIWSKSIQGEKSSSGYSVCQTSDGRYIVAGSSENAKTGKNDVFFIKTDSLGNVY